MTVGSPSPVLRAVERADRDALVRLWIAAFHDAPQAAELFFDRNINTMHGYCAELDGRIVSVLYLLPCTLNGAAAHYLCGVATEERYRGRGIMHALMDFALADAAQRGERYSLLYPADEGLYAFYARFGYVPRCRVRTVTLCRGESAAPPQGTPDTERLQTACFCDNFLFWNKNFLDFAADYYACYGVRTAVSENALAIFEEEDGRAVVLYSIFNDVEELKSLLFTHSDAREFILTGKPDHPFFANGAESDGGMIRPLGGAALPGNAYIGVTLN